MVQVVFSVLVWIYFALVTIVFLFPILIAFLLTFPFDPLRRWPNRMLKGLAYTFLYAIPGWHIDIQGTEHYQKEEPAICISNHQSFFDLPLFYLLPWTMRWVAKKSLFYIPILGWIIYLTGHIAIDRSRRLAFLNLEEAKPTLQSGMSVMIFPEGTRTNDGSVLPFKKGAFLLSFDQQVPIQPMVLYGAYEALPSGSWKFGLSQQFAIHVLPRIYPQDYDDVDQMKKEARSRIQEKLSELRLRYESHNTEVL
ncbi:MAG: lysophospholipid acyltransferase family protein [Bacteroidota bacterium]